MLPIVSDAFSYFSRPNDYDDRDRIERIEYYRTAAGSLTDWSEFDFFGYRDLERRYSNDASKRFWNGNIPSPVFDGYDFARREIKTDHFSLIHGFLDSYINTYDRMHNRMTEVRSVVPPTFPLFATFEDTFSYDSAYRLRQDAKDLIAGPFSFFPAWQGNYIYDGVGNRMNALEGKFIVEPVPYKN